MERRSWPWKKKSSEKSDAEKAIATLDSAGSSLPSGRSHIYKDDYKKPNYVQVSLESYSHLTGLENQVKAYEEQEKMYEEQAKAYEDQVQTLEGEINELNVKLISAKSDITTKVGIAKQHAKVAEEAVSGWEKAEREALALKNHLESVTLDKLSVENRAAHLDGALKECMKQIRNLKEDNEHKLQEVTHAKNKQYDRMKHELETKISYLDQDLMRAEAESAAISRSLQERSNMLIKVSEEKSKAEAEIELLKSNVESCEREINSLKYELHIVSKEMEIRNEEKNMSVKIAESANKQQVESVKKIAKLEVECQRLRGLVRKKLPGPAALAQMKLEVESLGRSPMRPSSPQFSNSHMLAMPEFQKENEFLTERLLAAEEETNMLKEALAKRNSELQTSRSICAKTASKLQSLETQVQSFNQLKGFPKANIYGQAERSFSQHASNPPSMASFSEDGNDEILSCAESCSSALVSELSYIKNKNKDKDNSKKSDNGSHLELMDDFEEMEKLAHIGNSRGNLAENTEVLSLVKLKSRISRVFESISNECDMVKILEDIKHVVQKVEDKLPPHTINCVFEEKEFFLSENGKIKEISQQLTAAISQIYEYIMLLGKEGRAVDVVSDDGLSHKIEQFSVTFNRVMRNEIGASDFIFALSDVMATASELRLDFLGYKVKEVEVTSPAFIDKVALSENKSSQGKSYSNGFGRISDLSSNPEFPQEANIISGFEPSSCKWSVEEVEQIKAEKDDMAREFLRCSQDLEKAKSQLREMEKQLSEVKLELGSSQKMNSLAETQLKCMAESYKTLEKRAEELEGEINDLREKMLSFNIELETERTNRQDALARCKDLEQQLQRNEEYSVCSSFGSKVDAKAKQEKELEAAAEKLAACQETIFLLGKQFKSMHPQTHLMEGIDVNEQTTSDMKLHNMDQVEMDTATSHTIQRVVSDLYNGSFSPSDPEGNISQTPVSSKNTRHRHTNSGSSTCSSTPTPDKHSRGLTRFFSSKGKNSN